MSKKIKSQLYLSLMLLTALMAVFIIVTSELNSRRYGLKPSRMIVVPDTELPKPIYQKVHVGSYSFKRYGLSTNLTLPEGIVANDYGDGLVQLAIRERSASDGQIAYGGGYSMVDIKISDNCDQEDTTYLCSQFDQLSKGQGVGTWEPLKREDGTVYRVSRKNLFAGEDDFFDDYYVKAENKVISFDYDKSPHEIYILEEMQGQTLPKLPPVAQEDKRVKDAATSLAQQLDVYRP